MLKMIMTLVLLASPILAGPMGMIRQMPRIIALVLALNLRPLCAATTVICGSMAAHNVASLRSAIAARLAFHYS